MSRHGRTLRFARRRLLQGADDFFREQAGIALTYDDVTLATLYSEILPRDTHLETALHERLQLRLPIISADMDTVTESRMAIAMALAGGLGLIHCNMPERQQLSEVSRVKNNVHGLIQEPIKVAPEQVDRRRARVRSRRRVSRFRTFPVVDENGTLLGLLPGHVVRPRYAATQRRRRDDAARAGPDDPRSANSATIRSPAPTAFSPSTSASTSCSSSTTTTACAACSRSATSSASCSERHAQLKPARDDAVPPALRRRRLRHAQLDGELDRDRILAHVGGLVERGVDVVAVSTAHGHSHRRRRHGAADPRRASRTCRSSPATSPAPRASSSSPTAARTSSRSARAPAPSAHTRSSPASAFRNSPRSTSPSRGRGAKRRPHPRRRRHHQERRHRQSAHPRPRA